MKKYILTLILLYINLSFVFSQVSVDIKNDYKTAVRFMEYGFYQDALPVLLKIDSLIPLNANINYNIGVCYSFLSSDKIKAVPYLENAAGNTSVKYSGEYSDATAPVTAFYYLGKAYHINNRIDEAIENFNKYKSFLTDKNAELGYTDVNERLKDVDRQIEMCYNVKKLMLNPVDIKIENAGSEINTKYPEYAPVISKDGTTLIFTSRREGSTGDKKDNADMYYEDIYIITLDKANNKWTNLKKIGSNINTNGHEASISLSADGKQLFIYKDDYGDGNIYVSKFINDEWTVPEKLDAEINTKALETHACLSPDGNTLYFISNREGGFGGKDIWSCERLSNGNWMKAQNLGNKINTIYDEESPFMLSDGVTLYFSSKGHENMGGFDVFTSTLSEQGFWSEPENIGYPINTTDDDIFYMPTSDEKQAYYASAKSGGYGDKDIYCITIVKEKRQIVILKGIISDDLTYKPIETKIEIKENKKENIIAVTSSSEDGEFYISLPAGNKYDITVNAENYFPYTETLKIPKTLENPTIIKTIFLKKVSTEEN